MTRFVDCFWGSDFTSTAGFDNLCRRLKDGKQTCQDFEDFVKQRADLEEKYGKGLMRLAKSNEAKDEIGSLKDSWDCLRNETENIGKAHLALAQQLLDDLDKTMREFREVQRGKRKQVEEVVKKAQRTKRHHYDNTIKLKRLYEQKCKEQDSADESLKRSVALASKDEEKLRSRLGRAKTAVEQADTAYQNSVRSLEEARVAWEHEMASCCNMFQSLEEERIAYLRNEMWIYTNLASLTCVKEDEVQFDLQQLQDLIDGLQSFPSESKDKGTAAMLVVKQKKQIYEEIRKNLENCDVNNDIKLFIGMRQTGAEKPAHIEYENYYMTQSSQRTTPLTSGPIAIGATVTGQPAGRETPQTIRSRRPPAALPSIPTEDPEYPSLYSSVEEARANQRPTQNAPRAKEKLCLALYDYDAQGDQELTFKAGDVIKVLFTEGDVWCCGILRDKKGMFPRTFVKMQ